MKTNHESINKIFQKAELDLEGLIRAYEKDKKLDMLNNYTEDAKLQYLIDLSEKYFSEGKKLQKMYAEKISEEYDSLIRIEKEKQRMKELEENKPKTLDQLLAENNKLLYSTFILSNGNTEQIKGLLDKYKGDKQIIEFVKTKKGKPEYAEVKQLISDMESDPAEILEWRKREAYNFYTTSDCFPSERALIPRLNKIFEVSERQQDKFFKQEPVKDKFFY